MILFTQRMRGGGTEKKGKEEEGKGGGIPFVNSGNSGSAGSLALGGCV